MRERLTEIAHFGRLRPVSVSEVPFGHQSAGAGGRQLAPLHPERKPNRDVAAVLRGVISSGL
jgi:hypothetical protein